MSLQQRSQLAVTRENNAPLQTLKNGLSKNQVAPRLALSTRSTNVATVTSHVLKATKPKLQPASLKQTVVEVPKPAPKSVQIDKIPLPIDMVDIDEDDMEHLEFSSVYVKDIYQYLFKIEGQNAAHPQYLQKHPTLRAHMRMILVEWLVSLQARFKLLQETLLMTVSILDRYMSETDMEVSRSKFQLVGVACMLVACKYEEMYLPSVSDFAYMCDGAYTSDDILRMERIVLSTLQFEFAKPLSAHFLRRFSKAGGADSLTHTMAKYFLELALYDYSLVHCNPSVVAAASLFIAGRVTGIVEWDETVQYYSQYKTEDLSFVVGKLAELGATVETNKYLKTTYKKYAADKFQRVAKVVVQSKEIAQLAKKPASN
ncbi:G2/mitotic-specific cyclin-B [Galendromus occidentalis]|uniref:G2/mitotic-specific cyclin-B n=1 Tax=Galendromus occidentalis TaxID=34638 RepID=A0AAJ6QPF6_9ACAR|nr:G2/mitotic-specific cyclin-B [Galendromus occidentalis]